MVQDLSLTAVKMVGVLVEEKIQQTRTVEDGSMQVNQILYIPSPRVKLVNNLILYKMDNAASIV